MNKIYLLIIIFLSVTCYTKAQNNQSVTFKLKIINHMPVGWGDKYKAVILEVVEGSSIQFGDTIIFGNNDFSSKDFFSTGDIRTISFYNTHKQNPNPYLPPASCTVSKLNEIWMIKEVLK
ncbi:MAG: hypothetical protein PHH30_03805 [Bacteroidales bacterium]|nr:hypothetical protein [Bacteroidales bacterium]MDD3858907.1 hypothetical protein [Bacteroidales bacterium]